MISPLPPKGKEINLALELRRLHWSQHQLARASQLRPEIISRLITGKVIMPYAETRKKILLALRQRAAELGMSPPNEVRLFPVSGEPVAYQERWQEILVEYARQIRWATRLTHELEPLDLLCLRFELTRREGEAALLGTLEHWEKPPIWSTMPPSEPLKASRGRLRRRKASSARLISLGRVSLWLLLPNMRCEAAE